MKTPSAKRSLVLIAFAIIMFVQFTSCRKDEVSFPDPATLPKGLTGYWIEVNTVIDTINFVYNNDSGYFNLSRGYAMSNGYWLPRIGSTSYTYKIAGDSISVVDGLSNSMEGGTYYFKFDEQNLVIRVGKFSKYISSPKSILTFRKIK